MRKFFEPAMAYSRSQVTRLPFLSVDPSMGPLEEMPSMLSFGAGLREIALEVI